MKEVDETNLLQRASQHERAAYDALVRALALAAADARLEDAS